MVKSIWKLQQMLTILFRPQCVIIFCDYVIFLSVTTHLQELKYENWITHSFMNISWAYFHTFGTLITISPYSLKLLIAYHFRMQIIKLQRKSPHNDQHWEIDKTIWKHCIAIMINKTVDRTNIMWMSFFKWETSNILLWIQYSTTELILGLHPVNENWRYFVMSSLIGSVQT